MVWVGKGLKRSSTVQALCHGYGHFPLDQVTQSPVQPGFAHLQEWDIHSFPEQPIPVPYHLHNKKFLPNVIAEPTLSLKPFPFVPSLHALVKSPSSDISLVTQKSNSREGFLLSIQ